MGNQSSVPTDVLRPQRPPLSGQAGLQALQQAERADQYLTLISQSSINRLARAATNYLPFPHSLKRGIPPADPMEPWPNGQVIWMQPSADDGLPHTRAPNYICIPVTMRDPKILASTLLHERVHVSQRLHPEAWRAILAEAWNMTPWSGLLPADIQSRRRLNPDLLSVPLFAWKGEWIPLGLFKSASQPKLAEIDTVWWNDKTRTLHREPPPGWSAFFGSANGQEHPFEMAAYMVQANLSNNPAYNALKPRLRKLPTSEV